MSSVSIIYLCYNDEPYKYLERMFAGVKNQSNQEKIQLIIVYNPGIVDKNKVCDYIKTKINDNKKELPKIIFLPQENNIGFVGGNNKGIEYVLQQTDISSDYIFLHNGDGFLGENAMDKMVDAMTKDKQIGVLQPLVMLYPEINKINTSGNIYQFLGFGYCGEYGVLQNLKKGDEQRPSKPFLREVGFASGSAFMMRVDLVAKYGGLDKDYFIYNEDLEYSLSLRSVGYKIQTLQSAIFYHEYTFSKNLSKYYYIERNRVMLLVTYYKWMTIFLIFPALVIMELGVWLFALKGGWTKYKIKEYKFWLKCCNWKMIWQKRKSAQEKRKIGDRELLKLSVGKVEFENLNSWLLKYIVNPFFQVYWKIVYWFIRW